ncbi:hypothetical protein EIP91_007046 [Steccherinum ochraceum]|uniref:Retrotransposon gag domain-containing protein n=1 Tax=Steccherinum ochraceum TaxID=92696 RepID=A0A4R0RFC9_9APHY|nr:hypothetical protein EIP91_007046 [Steccherinum ochraceum]
MSKHLNDTQALGRMRPSREVATSREVFDDDREDRPYGQLQTHDVSHRVKSTRGVNRAIQPSHSNASLPPIAHTSTRLMSMFRRTSDDDYKHSSPSLELAPSESSLKEQWHFDHILQIEMVPTWDGDMTKLVRWILRVNAISRMSRTVRRQLGFIAAWRLTGDAEDWFYSLPDEDREYCELDWENLREFIGNYYMNPSWVSQTRRQATAIRYKDPDHRHETPSQYFFRKSEALQLVYDYSPTQLISEIRAGAPCSWDMFLRPHLCRTTQELQDAIQYHKQHLPDI